MPPSATLSRPETSPAKADHDWSKRGLTRRHQLTMKLSSKRIIPRLCTHARDGTTRSGSVSSEMNLGLLYTLSPNPNVIWNHSTIRFIKQHANWRTKRAPVDRRDIWEWKSSRYIPRNCSSSWTSVLEDSVQDPLHGTTHSCSHGFS